MVTTNTRFTASLLNDNILVGLKKKKGIFYTTHGIDITVTPINEYGQI